ncbi:hypothetical protein PLICRDRAFT_55458 [Plicaturopsis crispa FD-325 SS-3]|nr:hypothetical protein PLICRDRAFT_55458 [Plicaturopsis crispa FD-325 SS-3]
MLSFPTSSWQASLIPKTRPFRDPGARCASLIVPRLYLSDLFTARNEEQLATLGITHVVSVLEYKPTFPASIHMLHVPIADRSDVDILSHLDKTTRFIVEALADPASKVLVHCFQGISRSATVVCAYLVASTDMLAPETIAFCQAKRGIVCPNLGFRHQLDAYEKQLHARLGRGPSLKGAGGIFKISSGFAEGMQKLRRIGGQRTRHASAATVQIASSAAVQNVQLAAKSDSINMGAVAKAS